jgi:hypothetical protein
LTLRRERALWRRSTPPSCVSRSGCLLRRVLLKLFGFHEQREKGGFEREDKGVVYRRVGAEREHDPAQPPRPDRGVFPGRGVRLRLEPSRQRWDLFLRRPLQGVRGVGSCAEAGVRWSAGRGRPLHGPHTADEYPPAPHTADARKERREPAPFEVDRGVQGMLLGASIGRFRTSPGAG